MLNDNLPIALYQQLVREFTAKLRNNAWPVGCMLPAEMQLCREYNVSRSTVRQAMDVLGPKRVGYAQAGARNLCGQAEAGAESG